MRITNNFVFSNNILFFVFH